MVVGEKPAAAHPFFGPEHDLWRATLRRWVAAEIAPNVDAWERGRGFPRELYRKAGDVGLLRIGFPEEYGGVAGDAFTHIVTTEELCRPASGGVVASLMSHSIGAPPIAAHGSDELKRRLLPPILDGEKISALAITEPSGGSDVANLRTTARRDGDVYVVNGAKTFITSGMRADVLTVAVRTGEPGLGGISLLAIDGDAPGVTRFAMEKMGWHASDTATIHFDDVRVPVADRIGAENAGFLAIMRNFNAERLGLAAQAIATAEVALEDAIAYARERETFGKPLASRQVIRHKIVEMARAIAAAKAYRDQVAWRITQGQSPVVDVCLLKVEATTALEFVAREAAQILGGASYTLGTKIERIYREVRVLAIGGGSEEIMRDLAARQMGLLVGYASAFRPELFAERHVVVTGGGSGIGRACAHELASLGAQVALVGRKLEKLESVAAEFAAAGYLVPTLHACDIRDEDAVKEMVAAVVAAHGRIDGLVNNAGGQFSAPLRSISARGWDAVVRTNLTGGFLVARECLTQSMERTGGAIVNIIADMWSSMPGMGHSGAARAGMLNFTMTAALEWAPYGVRVNAVAPGWIASSGMAQYPEAMRPMIRGLRRGVPLGRLGTEAETAAAVTFLLSDAASFITGSHLRVDGGAPNARLHWPMPKEPKAAPAFRGFDLEAPPAFLDET